MSEDNILQKKTRLELHRVCDDSSFLWLGTQESLVPFSSWSRVLSRRCCLFVQSRGCRLCPPFDTMAFVRAAITAREICCLGTDSSPKNCAGTGVDEAWTESATFKLRARSLTSHRQPVTKPLRTLQLSSMHTSGTVPGEQS